MLIKGLSSAFRKKEKKSYFNISFMYAENGRSVTAVVPLTEKQVQSFAVLHLFTSASIFN